MPDANAYAESNTYDIGDRVQMTAAFTDSAGIAADPDAVACRVRKPDGSELSPAVAHPGTGQFTAIVDPDAPGVWRYRFTGTGGVKAAAERAFIVREQLVP